MLSRAPGWELLDTLFEELSLWRAKWLPAAVFCLNRFDQITNKRQTLNNARASAGLTAQSQLSYVVVYVLDCAMVALDC